MKQVSVEGAGLHVDREMSWLAPGLVRMRQVYRVPERYSGTLVTGPQWLFSLVRIAQGIASFVVDGRDVAVPEQFALFIPAFTIVRFDWSRCEVVSTGLLGDAPISTARDAYICSARAESEPRTASEVQPFLSGENAIVVSGRRDPDSIATRAKAILDGHHDEKLTIDSVASDLGVSQSALSRAFDHQYGIGPLEYRQRIQVMNAIMRLSTGEKITAAAFDVGFADLSRFYKQFAKYARAAPSSYRDPAAPGAPSVRV